MAVLSDCFGRTAWGTPVSSDTVLHVGGLSVQIVSIKSAGGALVSGVLRRTDDRLPHFFGEAHLRIGGAGPRVHELKL